MNGSNVPVLSMRSGRRPASEATDVTPGRCTLVGAGPGDPDLLTLAAVKAIRRATVLLVDDLVDPRVLRWARRSARIVHVGKRGGCSSTPQAFIEKLMVGEARRGETVVRLKGGDPLIFGRAGEEMAALQAQGIAVEVVNGVSSALAAGADLGVSLTHRDHAHGVMFVTGHERDSATAIDWSAIAGVAASGMTLVIYMGVARLPRIQSGLLAGLPGRTPVALVERASRADRRLVGGRLDGLVALAEDHAIRSPAILIVGDVLSGATALAGAIGAGRAEPECGSECGPVSEPDCELVSGSAPDRRSARRAVG